jgi:hypothetical protein
MHGVWRAHSKVTDHRSAAQHHVVSTKRAQTATERHRVSHWPTHTHTCPMVVASPAPVPPLVPNLPAGQGPEQADVVSSDVAPNDPAGQALHPDAPASLYCPGMQLVQAPVRHPKAWRGMGKASSTTGHAAMAHGVISWDKQRAGGRRRMVGASGVQSYKLLPLIVSQTSLKFPLYILPMVHPGVTFGRDQASMT